MSLAATKTSLKELMSHVHEGKLQLPEFQRERPTIDEDALEDAA